MNINSRTYKHRGRDLAQVHAGGLTLNENQGALLIILKSVGHCLDIPPARIFVETRNQQKDLVNAKRWIIYFACQRGFKMTHVGQFLQITHGAVSIHYKNMKSDLQIYKQEKKLKAKIENHIKNMEIQMSGDVKLTLAEGYYNSVIKN